MSKICLFFFVRKITNLQYIQKRKRVTSVDLPKVEAVKPLVLKARFILVWFLLDESYSGFRDVLADTRTAIQAHSTFFY